MKRIIIIDKSSAVRRNLGDFLRNEGMEVISAPTVKDALREIDFFDGNTCEGVGFVISDTKGGKKVMDFMRKPSGRHYETPLLFMHPAGSEPDVLKDPSEKSYFIAKRNLADEVPVNSDELMKIVRKYFPKRYI